MSEQNVEASRRLWGHFLAGDTDEVLAYLDEGIVVQEPSEMPGAGTYRGHEGWSEQISRFRELIGGLGYTVLEHVDCGDNVVTVVEATGVGAASGLAGTWSYAQVETWRQGKIVLISYFLSREAAVEAAKSL